MNLIPNYNLKNYNTFGVEVVAKYFVEVRSVSELQEVCIEAKKLRLPMLFLGGGSNILFTKDFQGLVVALKLEGVSETMLNEDEVLVTAGAGESWHQLVCYTLAQGYGGLENLSLIPGSVGAAPIQNIGAYGVEVKDVIAYCEVLDLETLLPVCLDKSECHFGYRDSIFKQNKGRYVVLSVTFKLSRINHQIKIDYGAIRSQLAYMKVDNPTIQEVSEAVIAIRESKLPDPKKIGNVGSFFKNPTISISDFKQLQLEYADLPGYPTESGVKVPAGWLIEQAGWKGKRLGNVAVHTQQALVIINHTGKATGTEIFDFSERIIQDVNTKFGILLEREVNVV